MVLDSIGKSVQSRQREKQVKKYFIIIEIYNEAKYPCKGNTPRKHTTSVYKGPSQISTAYSVNNVCTVYTVNIVYIVDTF